MNSLDPQPSTDGRRRRSQLSRERIVTAMMALVEEGRLNPSAEEVAERAQVGLRSVFRHFNDMDGLYAEMALKLAHVYQSALAPFESPDWQGQLAEAIERRVAVYERLLPFKRAADAHRHESAVLQDNYAATSRLSRARLRDLLPPALKDDPEALETLDFLLSIDSWQRLRTEQKLAVEQARRIVETLVATLAGRAV
jgi:AcrR family transcriptional regulator